jgi:polar amino acid transport system permease protein
VSRIDETPDLTGDVAPASAARTVGEPIRAVPVRHPGRWASAVVLLVLIAMLVNALAFAKVERGGVVQPRFEWNVVGQYLFARPVLDGLVVTIELTVIAMAIGIVLGIVLAVMRLSPNPLVSGASWIYTWFFRGTPVLVQLYFWFLIAYAFPHLSIGIPFGPAFVHINSNTFITAFTAAIMGLGLNEGAYMAEIVRAGILSVDEGQIEAAKSIGMSRLMSMRRIVLPQAMRVILPPTGNETISMLKTSSLASAITVTELFLSVQNIYARTYQTVPLLIVASLWYLAMTTVLSIGQYYVERHYARGSVRELPPTPLQRMRRRFGLRQGAGAERARPPLPLAGAGTIEQTHHV